MDQRPNNALLKFDWCRRIVPRCCQVEPSIVERICTRGADFLICPSGGMFGPEKNDPIVQQRSRENNIHIVFVHPAEFLVTGPGSGILAQAVLGGRLLITPEQTGACTTSTASFILMCRRFVGPEAVEKVK